MAQNPQQPNNSANFPFLYQNQYYQNQLYYPYNSQPNSITQGKINQVNINTPPPPGFLNYNSQPSPPGTTSSVAQPTLQSQQSYNFPYYPSYQYPYYYQQTQQAQKPQSLYSNNIYNSQPQTQSQPPPLPFEQPPPPPGCPPQVNSINSSINNNNSIPIINNTKEQQQNKNNQYNQIKLNTNSNINQNSFQPAYIAVQPEKPKNNLENNNNNNIKTEMKNKKQENDVYPQSLKTYIANMYRKCPKSKLDILDKELKKLIDDAKLRNALHIIKWEDMDLPLSCQDIKPEIKTEENQTLSNSLLLNNNNKKKRKKRK